MEPDLLGLRLRVTDRRIPCRRGERRLAVGLGVRGLADIDLQLLFLLLRLELGDLRLFLDDRLPRGRLREGTLLGRVLVRAVDLCLEARLLDLGVANRRGDLRRRVLLLGDRLAIGDRAGDPGVLLDRRLVRNREVLDVLAGTRDRLDLEAVDHQAERFHLLAAAVPDELRELVLVADHVLDGHEPGDRPEVPDEHVLDLRFQLIGGPVEEAAGRVRDRRVVVADLVDDDPAQVEADLLLADAGDRDLAFVRLERQGAHLRHPGDDERAAPRDDPEPHRAGRVGRAGPEPGDDERLVGLGDPPAQPEQQEHGDHRDDDDADGD